MDLSKLSPEARRAVTVARQSVNDRRVNPLLESLPLWVEEYRPHQDTAIEQVLDAYTRVPLVVVDAPTGSGKTLIAETVRRRRQTKAIYLSASKGLQDQFLGDYPYARVLKGRNNYPTRLFAKAFHPESYVGHISCEDCTATKENAFKCKYCGSKQACPYEIAKTGALAADVAVLNTSYFLAEVNNIGRFDKYPFVIVDEADELESSLMGYVSVELGERRLEQWGLDAPEKVTVEASWEEWIDETAASLQRRYDSIPDLLDDIRVLREARALARTIDNLTLVKSGLASGAWVYTGRSRKDDKGRGVAFKPSRVDFLGRGFVWDHAPYWLLMSATVISSQEMLESLGYDGPYETVTVQNTFPVENRRVKFRDVADMAMKNKEVAWPKMAKAVQEIVDSHPDDRILVHTVSYAMTRYLQERISGRTVLSYSGAAGKDESLHSFRTIPRSVLLSPSMERGVDLRDDDCRVQIIVKVPFGYLGDKQIAKRLYGSRNGKTWYAVQTIRTIVQMCGRAVRSDTDYATTYILDSQFKNRLYGPWRNLFPRWFVEAIVWR